MRMINFNPSNIDKASNATQHVYSNSSCILSWIITKQFEFSAFIIIIIPFFDIHCR